MIVQITVYRVPTGVGDSFNEFASLSAANLYRQQQGIQAQAQQVVKQADPPEQEPQ